MARNEDDEETISCEPWATACHSVPYGGGSGSPVTINIITPRKKKGHEED